MSSCCPTKIINSIFMWSDKHASLECLMWRWNLLHVLSISTRSQPLQLLAQETRCYHHSQDSCWALNIFRDMITVYHIHTALCTQKVLTLGIDVCWFKQCQHLLVSFVEIWCRLCCIQQNGSRLSSSLSTSDIHLLPGLVHRCYNCFLVLFIEWVIFTVRRCALHCLWDRNSVCLSVCHTRGLCPHGSTYDHDFFTIW